MAAAVVVGTPQLLAAAAVTGRLTLLVLLRPQLLLPPRSRSPRSPSIRGTGRHGTPRRSRAEAAVVSVLVLVLVVLVAAVPNSKAPWLASTTAVTLRRSLLTVQPLTLLQGQVVVVVLLLLLLTPRLPFAACQGGCAPSTRRQRRPRR